MNAIFHIAPAHGTVIQILALSENAVICISLSALGFRVAKNQFRYMEQVAVSILLSLVQQEGYELFCFWC